MRFLIMGKDHQGHGHLIASTGSAAEAKELRDEQEGYASIDIHGPGGVVSEDELMELIKREGNVSWH